MKNYTHHTIRLKGVPQQRVKIPYVLRRHQVNQVIRAFIKATRVNSIEDKVYMWSNAKRRFVEV
jgi:hypothetical protein